MSAAVTHLLRLAALIAPLLMLLPQAEAQARREPGSEARVIGIGYGVLATPMSVLGELMRRDRLLHESARAAGVEFRFHTFEKGVDAMAPMLEGTLDASMPTDVVALDLIARHDVVLLGYVRQSFSSVIGPRSMTMADLRGKKVGNARGTSGHSALLQGLSGAGLSEKDVALVQMNVRDMPEALLKGSIDAFAAFEPTPATTLRKHSGRFKALHRQMSPAYFVMSRRTAEAHPEAARLLVASLHRAVRWMSANRANLEQASRWTLRTMSKFTGAPTELGERDIAALTRSDLLEVAGAPLIPEGERRQGGALWRSFDFFRKAGKLPPQFEWTRVEASFDRELTAAVVTHGKAYRIGEASYDER